MKNHISIFLTTILLPVFFVENKQSETIYTVEKIAELPSINFHDKNPGVAGAFPGITGDKLIVAGGANFPDKKPWEGGNNPAQST